LNQGGERFVRIQRVLKRERNFDGKVAYKNHQLELTIPSRFKSAVEPFLNKDLNFETKIEGDSLVIELKTAENTM